MLRSCLALCAAVTALAIATPRPAEAVVAPLEDVDGTWFARPVEGVSAIAVALTLEQPAAAREAWIVDAEVWLRNGRPLDMTVPIASLLPGGTVYVDGIAADTRPGRVARDPASPEHTYRDAALLTLDVPAETVVSVRVTGQIEPVVDALGQVFVELPTHALGLFEGTIHGGTMIATLRERPYAARATISDFTRYDEPANRLSWQLREWTPTVPFRLTYLPTWSALQLMTEIEDCPAPWPLVRAMSEGDMAGVRGIASTYDAAALRFCANLPLVVHGFPFESERARNELLAVPLSRYLTGREVSGSAYVINPHFAEDDLTDAERIYRHTLRQLADERDVAAPVPE